VTLGSPYSLDNLPQSIWIPKFATSQACYHGSPVEILQDLAREMGPAVGLDDAIRHLVDDMDEQGIQVRIRIPSATEAPRQTRAALLVLVLLLTGYAREVPQA
jgi:hypothetical protein